MFTKYIVGLILEHIFTLILQDQPEGIERFRRITSDWLTVDQANELYRFLRSWFYEDITLTSAISYTSEPLDLEESQTLTTISSS